MSALARSSAREGLPASVAPLTRCRAFHARPWLAALTQSWARDRSSRVPSQRPKDIETTAMGAAISAGLGAGVWASVDDVSASGAAGELDRCFEPQISTAERDMRRERWARAVQASLGWAS